MSIFFSVSLFSIRVIDFLLSIRIVLLELLFSFILHPLCLHKAFALMPIEVGWCVKSFMVNLCLCLANLQKYSFSKHLEPRYSHVIFPTLSVTRLIGFLCLLLLFQRQVNSKMHSIFHSRLYSISKFFCRFQSS